MKRKFEIHLVYKFYPWRETIECDQVRFLPNGITAVIDDSATMIFPCDKVIIKSIVQNFGWAEDIENANNHINGALTRDRSKGNEGIY